MIKIYKDIESKRKDIENCISHFGWTSDHNLNWFIDAGLSKDSKPIFAEFPDGTGLLVHDYGKEWWLWSDPLCAKISAADKILEFCDYAFENGVDTIWCVDVSDDIRPLLIAGKANVGSVDYSLFWPVLDLEKYDPTLPGRSFKEMRNAKNKFYREHKVEVVGINKIKKEDLHKIIDSWMSQASLKQNIEDIADIKYHNAVENNFRAFSTARTLVVDGVPVGINAGYNVPNNPDRFAGIVGIHDYSFNDLGSILWLEDLEWIKNARYKELDMQGSEDDGGLKLKLRFGAHIERKTDTFCIKK